MTKPHDVRVTTFSGATIYPFRAPDEIAQLIRIEDVAHHLANICRWTGAVRSFFSVAEHSMLCARVALERFAVFSDAPECGLAALLHDAPEYVLNDLAAPIKYVDSGLEAYHLSEGLMAKAVSIALGGPPTMPDWLHRLDKEMARAEAWSLMPRAADQPRPDMNLPEFVWEALAHPMRSGDARAPFLQLYTDLTMAMVSRRVFDVPMMLSRGAAPDDHDAAPLGPA